MKPSKVETEVHLQDLLLQSQSLQAVAGLRRDDHHGDPTPALGDERAAAKAVLHHTLLPLGWPGFVQLADIDQGLDDELILSTRDGWAELYDLKKDKSETFNLKEHYSRE